MHVWSLPGGLFKQGNQCDAQHACVCGTCNVIDMLVQGQHVHFHQVKLCWLCKWALSTSSMQACEMQPCELYCLASSCILWSPACRSRLPPAPQCSSRAWRAVCWACGQHTARACACSPVMVCGTQCWARAWHPSAMWMQMQSRQRCTLLTLTAPLWASLRCAVRMVATWP